VTTTYDCTSDDQRALGLEHAQRAISEKKCVVFPTDTVYGIAADAFSPQAVTMLLVSKGRSRTMPPPVLIPRLNALDGLATDVSADARRLAEAFWPGGLTLILHAQPSLDWDLGETKGTVALRMPADEIAQELLTLTGPLAVSSANRTGQAPAQTAVEARAHYFRSRHGPRVHQGDGVDGRRLGRQPAEQQGQLLMAVKGYCRDGDFGLHVSSLVNRRRRWCR
jgi:L-threonylcarbamoyladenylate synthase